MRKLVKWSVPAALLIAATVVVSQISQIKKRVMTMEHPVVVSLGERVLLNTTSANTLVEVTLLPSTVADGEDFLVQIFARGASGNYDIPLDTVSFFPPPIEGEERRFVVDLGSSNTENFALALVPLGATIELSSEIEVLGAAWVD